MTTARQEIRERLEANKCSVSTCDEAAYNEEITEEDSEQNSEFVEECKEHKALNELLIKQLNIGVKFEDTRQGRYARTPRFLAAQRRYAETERGKEIRQKSREKYKETEQGKNALRKYEKSDSRKLAKARYRNSEKGKIVKQRELEKRKVDRLISHAVRRLKAGLCTACGIDINTCTNTLHGQQNTVYRNFLNE